MMEAQAAGWGSVGQGFIELICLLCYVISEMIPHQLEIARR